MRRLVFAMLLLTAGGCASDKSTLLQAADFDKGISGVEMRDVELNAYFAKVGSRIITAARMAEQDKYGPRSHYRDKSDWMYQGVEFHLVNSKTLNAFTTGGTHIYVYNELFQLCRSEDELAAVMSHEFGHVYCRHVQKGADRKYGVIAMTLGLGAVGYLVGDDDHRAQYAGYGAAAGMVAGNFASMSFTRGDEAEADETGFHFYVLGGWDPKRFGDFFESMIAKGYDKGSAYLSDHPKLSDRLAEAKQRGQSLPGLPKGARDLRRENVATPEMFTRYQQLAKAIGQRMPTDRTLVTAQKVLAAVPRSCLTPAVQPDQTQARQELAEQAKQNAAAKK